jgi:GNAT superfamily N-acetyltransferase
MRAFDEYLRAIDPAQHALRSEAVHARVAALLTGPDPAAQAWLAEGQGGPVGYLAASFILWMDDAALAVWVSDLYVAPEARGAGAGRALMDAARAAGAARGARRLVWTVWRLNAPALAWYRRLGAEPVDDEILLTLSTT